MADYTKPDHWSIKAQKEAYPARSVYKLKEMDEKFRLFRKGCKVLDLGAAPGSWSLYIMRNYNHAGRADSVISLAAVDLAPLSRQFDQGLFDRPEFVFYQGDFTQSGIREKILSHGPYNVLVSDAAPATSGNRSLDTLRSLDLAETVLGYAEAALAKGGNLVVKVFQGGDTGNFLKSIRGLFTSGRSFKPESCRAESFETYYLGLGKK
jgi:23S rRNA (uridine2552-2'-O)-methyltransferase